jgi:hypothetical protein
MADAMIINIGLNLSDILGAVQDLGKMTLSQQNVMIIVYMLFTFFLLRASLLLGISGTCNNTKQQRFSSEYSLLEHPTLSTAQIMLLSL